MEPIATTLTCMVYGKNRNEITEIFEKIDLGVDEDVTVTHVRMKYKVDSVKKEEKKGDRRTKAKKGDRSGKGVDAFSNQTTIELLLDEKKKINLMCFATSIKIVGCRKIEDGIRVVKWFKGKFPVNEYTIEPVMQNMKLSLNTEKKKIDREKLNILFNEHYTGDGFSQFEPALYPNVMVIFSFSDDMRKIYKICEDDSLEELKENPFGKNGERTIEAKLKIYESSQVVITGTNVDVCMKSIKEFIKFFEENKVEILEV